MKLVTRTITTSEVFVAEIVVQNGMVKQIDLDSFAIDADLNDKAALRQARKQYPHVKNIVVLDVKKHDTLIGMDLETFIANARVITK